jgi:hypothetical protein
MRRLFSNRARVTGIWQRFETKLAISPQLIDSEWDSDWVWGAMEQKTRLRIQATSSAKSDELLSGQIEKAMATAS